MNHVESAHPKKQDIVPIRGVDNVQNDPVKPGHSEDPMYLLVKTLFGIPFL